ncbi:hypothetical protein HDU81_007506 [Chytriomyces hyalinus]|nr:hypothetical protein HDU81_007506 [Chytriomyces hyalinus]
MHAVNPTRMFRTHVPLFGLPSRVLRFNSAVFVPLVSRRFSTPVTPTTLQPPTSAAPSAVPRLTHPIKPDIPKSTQPIKPTPKKQTQSLIHTFNQQYLPALSEFMNKVTGYDSVVERKLRVEVKGNQLKDASRTLEDAKFKYEESIDERRRCQKEINSLLQRKDSWIDQDILQFTTLYRKDHTLEAKETETKVAYKAASVQYDTINTDYLSLIRERYIDEQLYSDKIRAASVYWTILHLSIFLIFSLVGWGLKVRDREVLLAGVEEIFAKSLAATQSQEDAKTDFAKLLAKDGTVAGDGSAGADSIVVDGTSTPHESSSREGTFLFRGATTWVAHRLGIPREDASFVVGLCLGAATAMQLLLVLSSVAAMALALPASYVAPAAATPSVVAVPAVPSCVTPPAPNKVTPPADVKPTTAAYVPPTPPANLKPTTAAAYVPATPPANLKPTVVAYVPATPPADVKPTIAAAYVPPTPPAKITPTPPADGKPTTAAAYVPPTPPANLKPTTAAYLPATPPADIKPTTAAAYIPPTPPAKITPTPPADVKPTTVAAYVPPTPPAKITPPADVKPTTVGYIAPPPPANVAPKTTPVYNAPANVNPATKKKCVPKVVAPPAQNVPAPVTSAARASEVVVQATTGKYEPAPTTRAAGSVYEPITTGVESVAPVTVAATTESEVASTSASVVVAVTTTAAASVVSSSAAPVASSTSAAVTTASSVESVAAPTSSVAPTTVAASTVASTTTSKVVIDIKIGSKTTTTPRATRSAATPAKKGAASGSSSSQAQTKKRSRSADPAVAAVSVAKKGSRISAMRARESLPGTSKNGAADLSDQDMGTPSGTPSVASRKRAVANGKQKQAAPAAPKEKKEPKVIYISDDESDDDSDLDEEDNDSADEDFDVNRGFDVDQVSKLFGKRGRRHVEEEEDSEDDAEHADEGSDNENNDENEQGTSKRRKSAKKPKKEKAPKAEKAAGGMSAKKARENAALKAANIAHRKTLQQPELIALSDSVAPDTSCCLVCSSREFARAAKTNNLDLVKACLDDHTGVGNWIFSSPPDNPFMGALSTAVTKHHDEFIHLLLKPRDDGKENPHPSGRFTESSSSTGHVNYRSYGRAMKAVNQARGNKEGNDAFYRTFTTSPFDFDKRGTPTSVGNDKDDWWNIALRTACRDRQPFDEKIFDRLSLGHPDRNPQSAFSSWGLYEAAISGNYKIASKMLNMMMDYGEFNILHRESVSLEVDVPFTSIKPVSVLKKASRELHCIKPLHMSAINPDSKKLEALMDAITPANHLDADEFGRTIMHFAATCEGTGPLKHLLDLKFEPRSMDLAKMTPLLLASKYGRSENIKLLIEAMGGGKDAVDMTYLASSLTALHFAAGMGHLEAVKVLLNAGATVDLVEKKEKCTALMFACKYGHAEIVNVLLEHGADVMLTDNMGRTPLIHACKNGYYNIVVKLLNEGSNVMALDSSENTALHYACGYGWKDVVDLLLTYGEADLNAANAWKCNPLMIADIKGHVGLVRHLLEKPGITVDFLDSEGYSMIHLMFVKGSVESAYEADALLMKLEMLLNHGADPNLKGLNENTALHLLCNWSVWFGAEQAKDATFTDVNVYEFLVKCFKILVAKGADLEARNKDGETPLKIALKNAYFPIMSALLEAGASPVNVVGIKGRTFMHLCCAAFVKVDGIKFEKHHSFREKEFEGFEKRQERALAGALEFIKVLMRDEYKEVVAAQMLEADDEGYTPMLRGMQSAVVTQSTGSENLLKECSNQSWLYGVKDLPVNLQHTHTCWLHFAKEILKRSPQLVKTRVALPRNFVKAKPTDPNPAKLGYSMLHFAAWKVESQLVEMLLNNGADVNAAGDDLSTPLHFLVQRLFEKQEVPRASEYFKYILRDLKGDQLKCLTAFVDAGVNVLMPKVGDETALYRIIKYMEADWKGIEVDMKAVLERLFASAKNFEASGFDHISKNDKKSCVMVAFEKGYDGLAAKFVQAGASLSLTGVNNVSIPLLAIRQARLSAANVVKDADLSIPDSNNVTCLMEACQRSDELVELLLANKGDLNIGQVNKTSQNALILAVLGGRSASIVRKLVERGADVNFVSAHGKTALIHAIEHKFLAVVKALIELGAKVDVKDSRQYAMHYAVETRNVKIVAALLDARADANVHRDKDNASPLHVAVEETKKEVDKSLKIERALIQAGAKINAVDAQGRTPLHIPFVGLGTVPLMGFTAKEREVRSKYDSDVAQRNSVHQRALDSVERVLGVGAKTSMPEVFEWFFQKPKQEAEKSAPEIEDKRSQADEFVKGVFEVESRNKSDPVELVDYLAGLKGISTDVVDRFGRSPLHYAARVGASSCTNALIKSGAEMDRNDKDDNSPLQLSLIGENVDFFLNLALQGADVNGKIVLANGKKETNFYYALSKGYMSIGYFIKNQGKLNPIEIISDALRTGKYSLALTVLGSLSRAQVLTKDSDSRTFLHILCDFQATHSKVWEDEYAEEMINILLKEGVDVNAVDSKGRTALIVAAENNHCVLADLLLRVSGININAMDNSGCTALLNAVMKSKSELILGKLIEHGVDVNHADTSKQVSVLRAAVDSQKIQIVKKLIEAGIAADCDEPHNKMTPLVKAIKLQNLEIVDLLIKLGADLNKPSPYQMSGEDGKSVIVTIKPLIAALENSGAAFEKLLTAGASVDARHPISDRTPLMIKLNVGMPKESLLNLLEKGADINLIDPKFKRSVFYRGVFENISFFSELDETLKRFKPDATVSDPVTGWNLIDHAINNTDLQLLEKVLALGASANVCSSVKANPDKLTSVMRAVKSNFAKGAKALVTIGKADLKLADANGRTVIHHVVMPEDVASYENVDLFDFLVEHGAQVDTKDAEGNRPIDYAVRSSARLLYDRLVALKCPRPRAPQTLDTEMVDAIVPLSDAEEDAKLQRIEIERAMEQDAMKKMLEQARERNVDVSVLKAEAKQKEWVAVDRSAAMDDAQVRVLFEGDGVETYKPYDVLMHKCDVSKGVYGENKFYKMQVIHNHLQDMYFLFNKWGGIGQGDGMFQKTPYNSKEECIKEFKKVFKAKSGNEWDTEFTEKPGKYLLAKTTKKNPVTAKPLDFKGTPASQLHEPVFEVLKMFMDVAAMKPSASTSDLSLPYDGLPESGVVQKAYEILTDLRETIIEFDRMLKDPAAIPDAKTMLRLREKLVLLSTDYFRLVPTTEFGRRGLSPIMSLELLSAQMVRINNLRYYDAGLTLLLSAAYNRLRYNPIDYAYAALGCSMKPLEAGSENSLLRRWIDSTKGDASVDVVSILKVSREAESAAFEGNLSNRKLLFHGSRMSNFLGILKSGLRVAPIEAPVTGYMFGKGIYFADVFQKSYNYVFDHIGRGGGREAYGCLLICDVALGTSYEAVQADSNLEVAKAGSDSTKGLGRRVPKSDGELTMFKDSVRLPMGPIVDAPARDAGVTDYSLTHNEYIIYRPTQVQIKYMVVVRDNSVCHLCSSCSGGLKRCTEYAQDYERVTALPRRCPFESDVVGVVMDHRGDSGKKLWHDEMSGYIAAKKYEPTWTPPTTLRDDSKICKRCADLLMGSLMELYLQEHKDAVPKPLVERENCWYGRDCRTQGSNSEHARKFNHFCDKKPEEERAVAEKALQHNSDIIEEDNVTVNEDSDKETSDGDEDDEDEDDEDEDEDDE